MKKAKKPTAKANWFVLRAVETNTKAHEMIKRRNAARRKAVAALLDEHFSFREIGDLLGITGQRVGALVRYWELRDEARS